MYGLGNLPVLFVLLLTLSLHVKASPSAHKHAKLQLISISLPPLQYYTESNELDGYFVEVIKAALATTSIPYEMHLYPWARSYKMAQEDENVCIFSLNRVHEREQKFVWVQQLAITHSALYSLKSRNLTIANMEQAKEFIAATIRNGVYHQLLVRSGFEEGKNIYVVADFNALIKLLYAKSRVDFVLSDEFILRRTAKKLKLDASAFQRQFYLKDSPLKDYIACSVYTSEDVVERLKNAFQTIRENGNLAMINEKWRGLLGNTIIE